MERRKKGPKVDLNFFYEADQRVTSRLYFSLRSEGKKRFLQKYADIDLVKTSFQIFYEHCELLLKKERNHIVERMHLNNTTQSEKEALKSFYLSLLGQAAQYGWSVATEKRVVGDLLLQKSVSRISKENYVFTPGIPLATRWKHRCSTKWAMLRHQPFRDKWAQILLLHLQTFIPKSRRNQYSRFKRRTMYRTVNPEHRISRNHTIFGHPPTPHLVIFVETQGNISREKRYLKIVQ